MKSILQLKLNRHSILMKLLISFMAIILLFVSFNLVSLFIFRESAHDEIITYNETNLSNTTRGFEQYFQLLNVTLVNWYLKNEDLQKFNQPKLDYVAAGKVIDGLQNMADNPQLYLNNVFVFNAKLDFLLEKSRGGNPEGLFRSHYNNSEYPFEYWEREFAKPFYFKLYPAASFTQASDMPPKPQASQTGLVMPYMIKNKLNADLVLLAFIDARKLFRDYHQSINDNFYILDPQGVPMFSSDSTGELKLPAFAEGKNWVKEHGNYYFYQKGGTSGFTYVNIVPGAEISAHMYRLVVTLLVLLVVAAAISITVSVFFSMRFNNPVRKIVESIRHLNEQKAGAGPVNEFDLIHENIGRLVKLSKDADARLEQNNSLLHHYSLMNRLKRIRSGFVEPHIAEQEHLPFRFVLFQLAFKQPFWEELRGEEERATYFIREYVHQTIVSHIEDARTFQVESDQILSIMYMNESDERWREALETLKLVLSEDRQYCLITISVSSLYERSSQMTQAYEEVLTLNKHRPFHEETVLMDKLPDVKDEPHSLYASIEQELHVNLQEGNDALVLQTVKRTLAHMNKKQYPSVYFRQFAEEVARKTLRTVHTLGLDSNSSELSGRLAKIGRIHAPDELERYLDQLVTEVCRRVRHKKDERDPIIDGVAQYVETHYAEDISLDLLAERQNITGGYLSTYFKEKTGINFVDYMNEFRIQKAKDLLLQTDMKIQDIAGQTGYATMSSFNRMFKRYTGVTPSEYRRGGASNLRSIQ